MVLINIYWRKKRDTLPLRNRALEEVPPSGLTLSPFPSLSVVLCFCLCCLHHFAHFHIISSSSQIAVAQGNCICWSDLAWLTPPPKKYGDVRVMLAWAQPSLADWVVLPVTGQDNHISKYSPLLSPSPPHHRYQGQRCSPHTHWCILWIHFQLFFVSWTYNSPNCDTYLVHSFLNPFLSQLWKMQIIAHSIFNTRPYCTSSLPLQREFWLKLQLAFLLNLMRSLVGIAPPDSGFTVRSFDIPLSSKHQRHRRRIELAICGLFISIWESFGALCLSTQAQWKQ